MKRIILIFLAILLSLAMILPGTTAVMAEPEKEAKQRPTVRAALMLRVPDTAAVGQPVTITVFGKFSNQPVVGAEVYALKTEMMASPSDKKNYSATAVDYAALVNAEGIFFGETNKDGKVIGKFSDDGRYIMIAFKAGHFPGFTWISITPSSIKGLNLRSPGSAEVGKPITFAVVERASHEPVADAAIYGKKIGAISIAKPPSRPVVSSFFDNIIGIFKPKPVPAPVEGKATEIETVKIAEEDQDAEKLEKNGILLGYTNDKGELVYTFNETGHFALAAVKKGYAPGFARINVTIADQKALGIKAPDRAEVNQAVTMTVFERRTSQVVPKAGVYALRIGELLTVTPAEKPTTTVLTPQPPTVAPEVSVDVETVKAKGIFLGETDDKGQLMHSFDKAGRYVLAAIKEGYQAGFARISIGLASQKALGIRAPDQAEVGKPINIVTFERNNYQSVPKAALYALRLGEPDGPVPLPFEAMIKAEVASPAEAEKHAADVKIKGIFLGYTNENAHLLYTFEKPGHYLLVAIKDGYLPGFARTTIVIKIIVPRPTTSNAPK